jgi:hypothetical protein
MIRIQNIDGDEVRLYANDGVQMRGERKLRSLSRGQIAKVFRTLGIVEVRFWRPIDGPVPDYIESDGQYNRETGTVHFGCQFFNQKNTAKLRKWALARRKNGNRK